MTGAGLSIASVDEKGATLLTGEPWRHAEFVLRVGQSGGVDRRSIIAVLFFDAVIYAFRNARQVAMQQQRDAIERENRAFCEKYGRLFGIREHTLSAEDLEDIRTNERQPTLDNLGIF